jgi:hypothetical protein
MQQSWLLDSFGNAGVRHCRLLMFGTVFAFLIASNDGRCQDFGCGGPPPPPRPSRPLLGPLSPPRGGGYAIDLKFLASPGGLRGGIDAGIRFAGAYPGTSDGDRLLNPRASGNNDGGIQVGNGLVIARATANAGEGIASGGSNRGGGRMPLNPNLSASGTNDGGIQVGDVVVVVIPRATENPGEGIASGGSNRGGGCMPLNLNLGASGNSDGGIQVDNVLIVARVAANACMGTSWQESIGIISPGAPTDGDIR